MKKSVIISMIAALALVASGTALGATQEKGQRTGATTGMQQSQAAQQSNLAQINQLSNFQVQSLQGENLGQVDDVIVDLNEGQIGYVVISSTEMGQVEAEKFIVPWKALQPSVQENALTLTVDKAQLMSAPEGDIQQVLTQQEGQEIHQFYGVAPYWEESETEGMIPSQEFERQQELERQQRLQQQQQQERQQMR